jgi:catechol 2,3-dioxygenase-like lactoylglutathione lyase family enzyme
MPVELNHTIVHVSDRRAAAEWVSQILGLDPPKPYGPFYGVDLANGVQLDFADGAPDDVRPGHYAFLISEQEFDEIYARIVDQDVTHWADPSASRPGEINHNDGGRGVYFEGPDGDYLEVITRPYGGSG